MGDRTAMRVLVVGGGPDGLATAFWLRAIGCDVHVVERDAAPRDDGVMIDFFGPGFDAAEAMGIVPALERLQPAVAHWKFMDQSGLSLFSIEYGSLRQSLFGGRHFSMRRGDVRKALLALISSDLRVRYNRSVVAIRSFGPRITVTLSDGSADTYDFVVGADGVHSTTRRSWFGHGESFERYLGYDTATYVVSDPEVRALVGRDLCLLTGPGRQVTLYPGSGNNVTVCLLYERDEPLADRSLASIARELANAFSDFNSIVPRVIEALQVTTTIEYDSVTQVRLRHWSVGRVVLVGDACQCPSSIGAVGASLAIEGARTLARELVAADRNIPVAFAAYERRMHPAVVRAQAVGERLARWVAPRSKFRMMVRDVALRATVWPMTSAMMRRAVGAAKRIS